MEGAARDFGSLSRVLGVASVPGFGEMPRDRCVTGDPRNQTGQFLHSGPLCTVDLRLPDSECDGERYQGWQARCKQQRINVTHDAVQAHA